MKRLTFFILSAVGTIILVATVFLNLASFGKQASTRKINDSLQVPPNLLIEGLVYQDLMHAYSSETAKSYYGAYFLETNGLDGQYLRHLFTSFIPRVELGTNNLTISETGVIDKLTKTPGVLFWARINSVSNGISKVSAGCYEGPEGAVNLIYNLKLEGTNWVIINKSVTSVSRRNTHRILSCEDSFADKNALIADETRAIARLRKWRCYWVLDTQGSLASSATLG